MTQAEAEKFAAYRKGDLVVFLRSDPTMRRAWTVRAVRWTADLGILYDVALNAGVLFGVRESSLELFGTD